MSVLLIGEVAARAGVSAPAIRYYEEMGLLRPSARSEGAYRLYDDSDIEQILRETMRFEELTQQGHRLEVLAAYDGLELDL